MNVKYLINRAVREYPHRTAIIYKDVRLSFAELNTRVNRLANALLDLGIKKGDRVGMLLRNCNQFIEIDFALSKTGMVRVPLNARLRGEDHTYMLNDSAANILIFSEQHGNVVKEMRPHLESVEKFVCVPEGLAKGLADVVHNYDELLGYGSPEEPTGSIEEDDLHTLFYTSGTTGKPKGVMLTQKSWANVNINLLLDYGPFTQDDVLLNLQPLSHGAGFFVLPVFVKGGANVLVPEINPASVFETIEREKVTILKLVPTMIYQLVGSGYGRKYDLTSLHSIIYGGSPIAVPRLIEAIKYFGPKLVQLYGQAEGPMCITTLAKQDHVIDGPEEIVDRLKSAGKPCTNVEVRIVDDDGNEVPSGQVGEIIFRGDHIMTGYWERPEETAKTLKSGWIFTGDLGYADPQGFIFLVDRKKDMIISGAFNIYPKEIEDVIVNHSKVQEVAVIGVPDEKWGEAVKALVVPKKGQHISEEEIIDHCRQNMASFKKPKSVDFLPELPRNPYGKVMKKELRQKYWSGLDRKIH